MRDIDEIFKKLQSEREITQEELHQLILHECELGGVTIEELKEIKKTGIWPDGKYNLYSSDAEMLLNLLEEK